MQAISQLLNHIYHGLNRKAPTVALYIDFKKALDCLQFPILIGKLQKMNLEEGAVNWLKDRHGGLGRDSWYLHVNVYPQMALYSIKTYFMTI